MATGALVQHLTAFTTPNISASWDVAREKDGVRDGIDLDQLAPGSLTKNRPFPIRATALDGVRDVYSYVDDFYYRFHVIPQVIDFGAIANETARTVYIWNAYFSTESLDNIEGDGEITGITISGVTPPTSMKSLEIQGVTFTAPAEGPPSVEGDYTFTFSNGDEIVAPAIGARARIWQHPPNWKDGVTIEYAFRTEVLTSRSQREQRNALRQTPRKTISFNTHGSFGSMRTFNARMAQWLARPFIVPEYPRHVDFDSGMAANSTTVSVASVPSWLVEDMVVVLNYKDRYEARTVDNIIGDSIQFTTSSSLAWPVGTKLYPGLRSHVQDKISARMLTNAVVTARMVFNVDPAGEPDYPINDPTEFNDRELFAMRNNWGENVDIDWSQFGEIADFSRGRVDYFTPVDFNQELFKIGFVGKNNAEAENILQFYYRMKGAQGEFYRPTYQPDLLPKIIALNATVFLRIAGTETYEVYADDKINQALFVKLKTGQSQSNTVREITVIDDADGRDSLIEVDDPWSFTIDPDNVLYVSWMPVWRLASDNLTFEWKTDSVCTVQIQMQSLEALAPEAEPT